MFKLPNFRNLNHIFKQSPEKISELQKEREDLRNIVHRRYRTNILFCFTLFALTITLCLCWDTVNNPESSPENVKLAFTLIVSIVSGLIGFITGKAIS